MKNKSLNRFRKWHKWPSLIVGLLFLFWALSGIILNHRSLFSGFEVNRSLLSDNYQYSNWNNAAVKASVPFISDSILIYGNIGVWATTGEMKVFREVNDGFGSGIDRKKVTSLIKSTNGNYYAGTLFGLFFLDQNTNTWIKTDLPFENERITDIIQKDGNIMVLGRSLLATFDDKIPVSGIRIVNIPQPEQYDKRAGLFKTLWIIHSGEIYGRIGKLIVDAAGIVFILLTITGLIRFFAPKLIRRRKRKGGDLTRPAKWKRTATKWHKTAGIWMVPVLLITASTGIFLRPPLLIAIASAKVAKIKYSVLDNDNPWYDKLRAITWDDDLDKFFISTSDGMYLADAGFVSKPVRVTNEPPVSVMGINIFEKTGNNYLVGSFSGLYLWEPTTGYCIDAISGLPASAGNTTGKPIGNYLASGFLDLGGNRIFYLDYNLGAVNLAGGPEIQAMPENIASSSPMSLWNFALEVHTARIFSPLLGDLYILIVPLLGLWTLVILLTGLIVWVKLFRRKRKSITNCTKDVSDSGPSSLNYSNA